MKSRAWILVACVAALLGGVLWLALSLGAGERGPNASERTHAPGAAPLERETTALEEPRTSAPGAGATRTERARPSAESTAVLTGELDPELAVANWVEGRVELAPGTPLDEEAWVLARGRAFEQRAPHRARVGPDGRFRVAFERTTQVGWLVIDARYNYLSVEHAVRPAKPPKDIVLKGTLGACVRGRILLPPGGLEFAATLPEGEVTAGESSFDLFNIGRKAGRIASDLTFEVGGLEAPGQMHVALRARGLVVCKAAGVPVEAGRVTTVDLSPEVGVRLSGRVVDAAGAPVEAARVRAAYRGERADPFELLRESSETGADGRFEILGLSAGDLALVVRKDGFEPRVEPFGRLELGGRREGLEIALSAGLTIAGRVEFPGPLPAARAAVEVADLDTSGPTHALLSEYPLPLPESRAPVETAADGSFRITGLLPGTYTLTAEAWVAGERDTAAPADVESDRTRKVRRKGTPWSGRAERVAPGGAEVVIALKSGETIRGRVADSEGKPIERFTVTARPDRRSPGYSEEIKELERAFRDAEGRFALDGLRACGWTVTVRAKGCLDADPVKITVPGANGGLRFVLLRQAKLKGVVLDPDSKPLAKAKVYCQLDVSRSWMGSTSTIANEKGEFVLSQVPVGTVRLFADANGYARGESLRLEVGPGTTREKLTLSVARRGAIRGSVRRADGSPAPGSDVSVSEVDGQWSKEVKADPQGEFRFEGLGPGRYALESTERLPAQEAEAEGLRTRFSRQAEGESARATVLLGAGETATVTLGGKRAPSIRMHGRVEVPGGRAGSMTVRPLGASGRVRTATLGPEGTYEVELSAAGAHQVVIEPESSGRAWSTTVLVPSGVEFAHDFSVPGGSISGRVVDLEGAPIADQRVRAYAGAPLDHLGTNAIEPVESGQDGTFRIDALAPGTYTVEIDGAYQWWDESRSRGRARREGVVVTAEKPVTDLELVIASGAEVRVRVRSEGGTPVPFVEVFAFDERGHALNEEHGGTSNSAGTFVLRNAPGGTVFLYARTGSSAGKASVAVEEGRPAEIDLALRPAADLTVLAEEAPGVATTAPLEIVDAEGRRFEEIEPLARWLEKPERARGFPSLPPGRYTVRAHLPGGRVAEKSALLAEGGRVDVVLR